MTSRGHDPTRQPDSSREADTAKVSPAAGELSVGAGASRQSTPQAGDVVSDWFPKCTRYQQRGEPIAGGMGVVFHALDVNLDIHVAIKRIRPEFVSHQELIKRFEREAKTQVRLRHPNLVAVRDFAQDEKGPYIVMDWIHGRSLAQALKEDGPFEWQRVAGIIGKVAAALQVAHDAGIIHRDIKPANILLDDADEPYVTDFGLVRLEASQSMASETMTGALLGTVDFVAPEQLEDPRNASVQSDIWSLGATMYRLVTNRSVRGMRESLIPPELLEVTLAAMEEDLGERFGTMNDFAIALSQVGPTECQLPPLAVVVASDENPSGDLLDLFQSTHQGEQFELEKAATAHEEAREAIRARSDYQAAVTLLQAIPKKRRDKKLYQDCKRTAAEVAELSAQLAEKVKELDYESIRSLTLKLLKIQPRRRDLIELYESIPFQELEDEHPGILLRMPKIPAGDPISEVVFTKAFGDVKAQETLLSVTNQSQLFELKPSVDGLPTVWLVDEGDEVFEGDVIAAFDCDEDSQCELAACKPTAETEPNSTTNTSVDQWEAKKKPSGFWDRLFGG